MEKTIYLQLADGTCLTGKHFGAPLNEDIIAEVVFTTSMTGYVESLTDPSYYGQMLVQTFPLIGNYGINSDDYESSAIHMSAYITKEICTSPSNFRSQLNLNDFLKLYNVPGIYDIDTRYLTKIIRKSGVMNGRLTKIKPENNNFNSLSYWHIQNAVNSVTCQKSYTISASLPKYNVVLWDFGVKRNIIRKLHFLNCNVTVVPAKTTSKEILSLNPDGIMLSNGPGNPKENIDIINEIKQLCSCNIPIFGICLGHQLLALANGADTKKLKYGHRGANQPVKNIETNKIYITSQNHGYAVIPESLPNNSHIYFTNINDNTCEGIKYENFPGFSVQFHPEACSGPQDTDFLFNEFIELMSKHKA